MPVSARNRIVKEAKRLFRAQLAQSSIKLPKPASDMTLKALELAMVELMSSMSINNALIHKLPEKQKTTKTDQAELQPTPRLRRAMASANKVKRGRFATADELFKSLGQSAKK